ncbi:hypothetical protein HJD18_10595 [Thermoleophilia bacterium SCSIO 60948]|nr:hypothetical protein HJD18_10595 [Thermoleophilia bacterium SCSIO 60948]
MPAQPEVPPEEDAIAVLVMDRQGFDADTDVIVIAQIRRRHLLWVPRDLFSPRFGDRVNQAYKRGGHGLASEVLSGLGFHFERSLCLSIAAMQAGFAALGEVVVPVRRRYELWYPLSPLSPIEEGRRKVVFEPLAERLSGERFDQWVGARYEENGPSTDTVRLGRQQVLLATVLGEGRDLSPFVADPEARRIHGEGVLRDLAGVDAGWTMSTFKRHEPARIDGKRVQLVKLPGGGGGSDEPGRP